MCAKHGTYNIWFNYLMIFCFKTPYSHFAIEKNKAEDRLRIKINSVDYLKQ